MFIGHFAIGFAAKKALGTFRLFQPLSLPVAGYFWRFWRDWFRMQAEPT
jgi:hypothetical protein